MKTKCKPKIWILSWSRGKSCKRQFWGNWGNLDIDWIFWKYFKESYYCGFVKNDSYSQEMHVGLCTRKM